MNHTVIYKTSKSGGVTRDGHTMFNFDIVTELNRKAFLEVNKIELEKDLRSIDHAESCPCRMCAPDMPKNKERETIDTGDKFEDEVKDI